MRWNNFAGTAIIPTLARIVLAMAFITVGFHKLFDTVEYTAAEAETLRELGVELTPITAETVAFVTLLPQDADPDAPESIDQKPPMDARPVNSDDEADPPADGDGDGGAKPSEAVVDDDVTDQPGEMIEIPPLDPGARFQGGAIHKLTLMLHNLDFPNPRVLALIAALTEFAGGILILIGLFSRLWGLGLAITMGVAFYLTGMEPYFEIGPFEAAKLNENNWVYKLVFTQLGLGVLALTVFLVGPGPLSLDRLIFRSKRREENFEQIETRRENRQRS